MSVHGFTVVPAGVSIKVQATKQGAAVQLYFDQACTVTAPTPTTITTQTNFYVTAAGTYAVSMKSSNTELGTSAGEPYPLFVRDFDFPAIAPVSPLIVETAS